MAKKSYTENLIEIREFIATITERDIHLTNHLKNIDSHLDKLNNSVAENRERSMLNTDRIGQRTKVGVICLLLILSIVLGMRLFGVF